MEFLNSGVSTYCSIDLFQFAGGFDSESMKAFEELRDRVREQSSAVAATAGSEAP